MDNFTTAFLFTQNAPGIHGVLLSNFIPTLMTAGLFVLLLIGIWKTPRIRKSTSGAILLTILIGAIGVAGTAMSIRNNLETNTENDQEYRQLLSIYNTHQYQVVEGPVQVVHEQPYSGHAEGDIVDVNGVSFRFSEFDLSYGYHQTIAYHGVLQAGTYARIDYTQGIILRIDVKPSSP